MVSPTVHADIVGIESAPKRGSYVSWPAVFAGNAVTGGLILVMLPFGAAAGLALASPYGDRSASPGAIGWTAILWVAFMYLFSTSVGGYVTGRLRATSDDATTDEVRFRDMMNGLVFWGVGMIISALFTFMTVASAVSTATTAVTSAVGPAASEVASRIPAPSMDYTADVLLRGGGGQQGQPQARSEADVRAEITRILTMSAASGQISDADKSYLASLVARQAGLSEADARARVDQAINQANAMKADAVASAKQGAETARSAVAKGAFWTAVLSLLSGIAAMLAAGLGGRHRDQGKFL